MNLRKHSAWASLLAVAVFISTLVGNPATAAAAAPAKADIVAYLARHEGQMPAMMGVPEAVDMALKSHAANDGSTTHLRWGDLSGQQLYVVSLFPDLGIIKTGKDVSKDELTAFVNAHLDLLADPRVCFGTWFNKDDGNTYIDINVVLADKDAAVELGKRYNQISIFNLSTFEETKTGGDGKPIANLPAPMNRLPEFK